MKRRIINDTEALHLALILAANELERHMCGEQVGQMIEERGGTDLDADAVRRKLIILAGQLRGRAAALMVRD